LRSLWLRNKIAKYTCFRLRLVRLHTIKIGKIRRGNVDSVGGAVGAQEVMILLAKKIICWQSPETHYLRHFDNRHNIRFLLF
jgi:hypothetical protein